MDFTNDPFALAGLGVLSGKDLSTAMTEAAAAVRQRELDKQEMAYRQAQIGKLAQDARTEQLRMQMLSQLFGGQAQGQPQMQPTMNTNQGFLERPIQEVPQQQMAAPQMGNIDPYFAAGAIMGDPALVQLGAENMRMAREEQRDIKKAQVPGLELLPNSIPDSTTVREARTASASFKKLNSALDRLDSAIGKYGQQIVPGTEGYKVYSKHLADIRNAERTLANTGVLNVGEVPFLEEAYDAFNPKNITNYDPQRAREMLKEYRINRNQDFSTNLESMGYRAPAIQQQIEQPTVQQRPSRSQAMEEARRRGLIK